MLEALQCQQCGSSSWSASPRLPQVSGVSGLRYRLGSATSALTSALASATSYTQPFGSFGMGNAESLGDDMGEFISVVICWQNLSGILVVLLETVNEASCQHRGLRTTEVKSRHAVGWNGGPHWDSRGEVKSGVRDDGGVAVTVLAGFSTPSTASEIIVGG
jgi:hypothetical protein